LTLGSRKFLLRIDHVLTGLSRNTIRKYLRSGAVEPKFKVPDRPSKLDAFADRLARLLTAEASKPRKQKRTLKQLHVPSN
jgi:hypothetical protein